MFNMLNKIGIKVTEDEPKILVASATDDKSKLSLNMEEFMKLIFTDNE